MFDDFDTQVQSDELIPAEYEDWCSLLDEPSEDWLDEIEASLGRDRDYFPTWRAR